MTDQGVGTFGERAQVVSQIGVLQTLKGFFWVHLLAQHDVVEQGVVEHHDVLADQSNLLPEAIELPLANINPVQKDLAMTGVDQAGDQIGQSGFART